MGDLWLWLLTRLLELKILLSFPREGMGQRRGTRKGKKGRPHNTLYTEVCQAIPATCTMLGISQITGNVYLGLSQKHSVEWTPPSPSDPVPFTQPLLSDTNLILLKLSSVSGFSQELSFMDFPSSKCFCSTAGQSRPQHAWLRTAAAHPTAAPTWRGEGRKPLEGFTGTNSLSLRSVCLAS